jgi:thiosulfate reductase cytochrome b subunit
MFRAMSPLAWACTVVLGAAALYALHRLALWLDDRGWLYYRRSSRQRRHWRLRLAAALDPNARRILELHENVRLEEDEDGDPARPRVTRPESRS